jgi:hypothetical protein
VVAVNIFPAAALDSWTRYWKSVGGGDVVYAQDTRREAVRALEVRSAGATVVLDRQGREVWRDHSATDYETLKSAVEQALQ